MAFKIHRPSFVKNTPLLNALTTRGVRDADQSLTTAAPPADATSRAPSVIGRYAARVATLRRMATQQAASSHRPAPPTPSSVAAETVPNPGLLDPVSDLDLQGNRASDESSLSTVEERSTVHSDVAPIDELFALGEITTLNTTWESQRDEAIRRLNHLSSPPTTDDRAELLSELEEGLEAGKINEGTYCAYAAGLQAVVPQVVNHLAQIDPLEELRQNHREIEERVVRLIPNIESIETRYPTNGPEVRQRVQRLQRLLAEEAYWPRDVTNAEDFVNRYGSALIRLIPEIRTTEELIMESALRIFGIGPQHLTRPASDPTDPDEFSV